MLTGYCVNQRELLENFSVAELDMELIARGARTPEKSQFKFSDMERSQQRDAIMSKVKELYKTAPYVNQALSHISTPELVKLLMLKTRESNEDRLILGEDDRIDFFQIQDERIRRNANCVAAICLKDNLIDTNNGFFVFKVKNYGAAFNLCSDEPFCRQPISTGLMFTGFLVKQDVIATAAHCANEKNVTELRVFFDFKMLNPFKTVTQILNENIYKGVEIIRRVYNRSNGSDWALIKLDRKVVSKPIVELSENAISRNQPIYILGHPCGLPLKYTSEAKVRDITETCFAADLNVYCGSSGSPVFDSKTHEVIGIVVRGNNNDFRWTGKCWVSIIYPHPEKHSEKPQCTRVSEFIRNVKSRGQ